MRRETYHETGHSAAFAAILSAVSGIPYGRVASYGQIARIAGLPGRARLVGRVLSAAPESGSLPWHRVINGRGELSLTATSTFGREQRRRLRQEGVAIRKGRVDMDRYGWRVGGESPLLD